MYYDQGAEAEKDTLQRNWENSGIDRRDVVKSHAKPATKAL